MVTIISKKISRRMIASKMNRVKGRRGLKAGKYCGKIRLDKDPLVIQREFRNEWI
jgi:hypothetical protein